MTTVIENNTILIGNRHDNKKLYILNKVILCCVHTPQGIEEIIKN
jgi:hypothetical protein